MGPQADGRHGILIQVVAATRETAITGVIRDNTIIHVGNTSTGNSALGLAVLANDPRITRQMIELSRSTASGANMTYAFQWTTTSGTTRDALTIPDRTLCFR